MKTQEEQPASETAVSCASRLRSQSCKNFLAIAMSGRKRKTINIKRVTTRSVTGPGMIQKFLSGTNVDSTTEQSLMESEEYMQRREDNFWGLDKDLKDRQQEIGLMNEEDRLSMMLEYYYRMMKQHRLWDADYFEEQKWKESYVREEIVQQRLEHLRLVNSPYPVEEVIHHIWHLEDAEAAPLLPNIASLSLNSLYSMPNESKVGQADELLDPSMLSLESVRMPLHLEGLQRSREIVDQARASMKQALKDIHSTSKTMSLDSQQTPLPSLDKGKPPLPAAAPKVVPPPEPAYNAAVLGHPKYQWDQSRLLQAAFVVLDKEGKGYLSPEALGRVANDAAAHDLLQYTVFWSVIKAKDWTFFQRMLELNEVDSHSRLSTHSRDGFSKDSKSARPHLAPLNKMSSFKSDRSAATPSIPVKGVSFQTWLQAADGLTREGRVSLRRIRTTTEHEKYCATTSFRHDYYDSDHHGILRHHRLMRSLQVGECVWALHRNGVRWLPAVVEYIHVSPAIFSDETFQQSSWIFDSVDSLPTASSMDSHSAYTIDLWYPLSEQDLVQSRLNSTSKQLLTLPSQNVAEGLKPKPCFDERMACSHAFDLIDVESAGIVELEALVNSMKSIDMQFVVESSAVLTALFLGSPGTLEVDNLAMVKSMRKKKKTKVKPAKGPMPQLLPVFIDTFSTQSDNNENEELPENRVKHKKATSLDCVSKMDFLEFCDAVLTVIKFDVHRLRSK